MCAHVWACCGILCAPERARWRVVTRGGALSHTMCAHNVCNGQTPTSRSAGIYDTLLPDRVSCGHRPLNSSRFALAPTLPKQDIVKINSALAEKTRAVKIQIWCVFADVGHKPSVFARHSHCVHATDMQRVRKRQRSSCPHSNEIRLSRTKPEWVRL